MPVVDPSVPPEAWRLGAEGLAAAADLGERLPAGALLVASEEPKAQQTVGAARADPRFNEVRRDEPFDEDFRARRRAWVEGGGDPDWETREQVAGRFARGIVEWRARAGGRPLVVASHGMALTAWLHTAVALDDPGQFWADLRLPDAFEVDLDRRTITTICTWAT